MDTDNELRQPKPPDKAVSIFKLNTKWCRKYVIMALAENALKKSFNDYSPFKICRYIKSYAPNASIKFLKTGTLLITIETEKDFLNLQYAQNYENIPTTFSLHRSLNFSKGVIYVNELLNCTEDEIRDELKEQGVINVKRIYRSRNGDKIPTPTLIITFEKPEIPEKLIFDFLKVNVRPFEPNPLLCFSCYRYRRVQDKKLR